MKLAHVNSRGLVCRMRVATAARLVAALLVVGAGTAPVFSSWHEVMVQHVRCAEHGELTHVTAAHTHRAAPGRGLSVQSEDSPTPSDEHRHCDEACVVRGGGAAAVVRAVARYTPPQAPVRAVDRVMARPGRTFLLASAPKTSPPSA
jgi:hypothetical protein